MSYQLALEAAGCEVLDFVEFGCYQGEWLALIRKDGVLGVCEGSYGSCSGCDSFEAEFGWDERKVLIIRNVLLNLVKVTYQLTALKK